MARATGRHRIYEVEKAGWINIYPTLAAHQNEGIFRHIISLLKRALTRLTVIRRKLL